MSNVTELRKLVAGPTELRQAREAINHATTARLERWVVAETAGEAITLPSELSAIMTTILQTMARGGTVTVGSMPEDVTTTVAADLLGVSRPTLMKMVVEGELPSTKVGTHTRLKSDDVLNFKRARLERQRTAFDELLELEDEKTLGR